MEPTPHSNETALAAYLSAHQTAHALLARLAAQLDFHQDSLLHEHVNWGHVGAITRIVETLLTLIDTT